jgi:thymidylate kinase
MLAFVGSEASGKSTLSEDIFEWLGERFDVFLIHLGKPKKNWRTRIFWTCISIYSFLKSPLKKMNKNKEEITSLESLNLPHPIVCWLDSIDRKFWLEKHFHKMMQGAYIITDRYPAEYMDGPRIQPTSFLTKFLSKLEKKNYSNLPSPDVVIKVVAPLEETIQRNNLREYPEPEEFLRRRFELAKKINFPYSIMVNIDTTKPLEETKLELKEIIWNKGCTS